MLPQENNVRKGTAWSRLVAALIVLTIGAALSACRHGAEAPQETTAEVCVHEYRVVSTTATCTRRGVTVSVCDLCGETKEKYSNPLGHVFENYVCQREGCGFSSIYYAADFGAVGDGVTDDGPAISNAVNAARATQGKLIFESNKTYYIGTASAEMSDFKTPFSFLGCNDVILDGNGSTFLMAPELTYAVISGCVDITIVNCNFDLAVSVYLVGTVTAIDGKTVTFSTDAEPYKDHYDYTGTTAFSVKAQNGVQGYPHGFIKTMTKTGSQEVTVTYSSGMSYHVGQTVYLPNPGIGHTGSEVFYVGSNKGTVVFENVAVRAARNFVFAVKGNEAEIFFNNVDLVPAPDNDRAIKMVGWRDGFHCKDNRGALHFRDCENGVLFDDVFNVRGTLGCFTAVTDPYRFSAQSYGDKSAGRESPFDCMAGDVLDFYDQDNDEYYGCATVKSADISGSVRVITLEADGCTVDLTKIDPDTCRIGNRNTCAPGTTITDCHFTGSFRFSRELTAENTVFDILSIWILAEGGVEGPIPGNVTFRSCTFRHGYLQIDGYNRWDTGRYMPNIGAQIEGIRAYDCIFTDGCSVRSKTGGRLEIYENGVLKN